MHHHLYREHSFGMPNTVPPYRPVLPDELRRFNARCLRNDIHSLAYISPFEYYRAGGADLRFFLDECRGLLIDYGYRGLYVDGLLFDYRDVHLDDPALSVKILEELRRMVGPYGVIVAHLSHANKPAAFIPEAERLCDGVVKGEGFETDTLNDPYLLNEIATTRWTGVPVGWLYHRTWERLQQAGVTLDELMRWQVSHGMMGVTFSQMKVVDGRYRWSDGRTSYFQAWQRAVEEATNVSDADMDH